MSRREPETLPVVHAADLEEFDPARRWLIEPLWIHSAVGTIGGLPKSCKSWMGLDMAVSVASGTPCLDTFPVRDPGGVLLYMAEDAAPLVKARLVGLCRHRGLDLHALPIDVITTPTIRLDLPADQQRLAETVHRRAPRLLLLDPLVRLHQANENQASEVAAILGYLRALQRTYQVAVTVTHHARKNGAASGGLSLRGSGDFFAWVDTALSLRRRRSRGADPGAAGPRARPVPGPGPGPPTGGATAAGPGRRSRGHHSRRAGARRWPGTRAGLSARGRPRAPRTRRRGARSPGRRRADHPSRGSLGARSQAATSRDAAEWERELAQPWMPDPLSSDRQGEDRIRPAGRGGSTETRGNGSGH